MAISYRITDEQRRPQLRAKRFLERMAAIPPKVKRRINAANEKSAEELAAMMIRLAPTPITGDLLKSITYYEVTGNAGAGIVWRVVAGDDEGFHARFVEFGAAKGSAPRPFFYPSVRALRRLIKNRQLRAFRQGMKDSDT